MMPSPRLVALLALSAVGVSAARIGSMSAPDCARWPTGRTYGESDARRIAR